MNNFRDAVVRASQEFLPSRIRVKPQRQEKKILKTEARIQKLEMELNSQVLEQKQRNKYIEQLRKQKYKLTLLTNPDQLQQSEIKSDESQSDGENERSLSRLVQSMNKAEEVKQKEQNVQKQSQSQFESVLMKSQQEQRPLSNIRQRDLTYKKIGKKCIKAQTLMAQIDQHKVKGLNDRQVLRPLEKLIAISNYLQDAAPQLMDLHLNEQVQRTLLETKTMLQRLKEYSESIPQQQQEQSQLSQWRQRMVSKEYDEIVQRTQKLSISKLEETPTNQPLSKVNIKDEQKEKAVNRKSQQIKQEVQVQAIPVKDQQKPAVSDDADMCQICFEKKRQYLAVPCGHFIYCETCKDLAKKSCLVCRADVLQMVKVFL